VGAFKRVTAGGAFTVTNYKTVTEDKMSPARITTLKLVSSETNTFKISWNAVGDDVNIGNGNAISKDVPLLW
jgi:hypothetical protein